MVGLAVMGKHAFNGLPNHPSLDALKDDSEGDPKARVQKHLIAKGQEVKDTQLSVERACWMFEREINEELGTTTNEELKKMLRQILTDERPIKPLKPAELLDHLSSALKPYYAEREACQERYRRGRAGRSAHQADGQQTEEQAAAGHAGSSVRHRRHQLGRSDVPQVLRGRARPDHRGAHVLGKVRSAGHAHACRP